MHTHMMPHDAFTSCESSRVFRRIMRSGKIVHQIVVSKFAIVRELVLNFVGTDGNGAIGFKHSLPCR